MSFPRSLCVPQCACRTIPILVVAMVTLTVVAGCKQSAAPQPPPAVPVTVITIEPGDMPIQWEFVAQTKSSHEVEIRARVNGFLDKRVYTEGAMVKEGQVLFLMDKKPFQAQLDAATAALNRQKAALNVARMNLDRVKPLAAQNALSQKDLDDATGRYESSAAAVEQAKADLETAQLNLSYCTITSPIHGITAAAQVQDGAYVNQQNSQLTTVSALSPMWVNFSVSENEMKQYTDQTSRGEVRPPKDGSYTIEVVFADGSVFSQRGRITFASPSFDARTGTFLIRASVDNPDGTLRPNQYVRARVIGAVRRNAIAVPQRAVQQGAKGHFLWVVNKEGKAEARPVVIGSWYGENVFITEGLRAGEQVVVDGGISLQPGQPVTVKPPGAAAAPAATAQPLETATAKPGTAGAGK